MVKAQDIIVLLGNTNDMHGKLSESAILRAQTAIKLLNETPGCLILPTGSFGAHFNESPIPHGKLLAAYLVENGIDTNAILPHTRTGNTIDDAFGVLKILSNIKSIGKVLIVTSIFHMPRVKFIFGRALNGYQLEFHEAPDPSNREQLKKLLEHERRALAKTKKEWVELTNFDLDRFPESSYNNLGNEMRHYDNMSYFAIVGAILVASFFSSNQLQTNNKFFIFIHVGGILLIVAFWYVYLRLANTAASARRILSVIERLYKVPGLSATTSSSSAVWGVSPTVKQTIGLVFAIIILFVLLQLILSVLAH